jgi:8-oxo-dGTP diphosphatase
MATNQIELKNDSAQRPRVGVGVTIFKDRKVLLGKRKGSHGEGEFAFPGGHLEYMESFADCVRREVREECGIEIENIRFQFLANVVKYAPKHYVHIGLIADWKSGEPQVLEPDRCESWEWYELDNLPHPLFAMCKLAVQCNKTGKIYFDISDTI